MISIVGIDDCINDGKGNYSIPIDFPDTDDMPVEYRNKTITVTFDKRKPPCVGRKPLSGGALRYVKSIMRI